MTTPPTPKTLPDSREAFETWAASEGLNVARYDFDKQRYESSATQGKWRSWEASRAALVTSGEATAAQGALHIKVMYLDEDTPPFIFWCHGPVGGGVLGEIEADIAERPSDILDKGFGDYEFRVVRDSGQYGEAGMCEISPYWDFTDISFTPHVEGAPAWASPAAPGNGEGGK